MLALHLDMTLVLMRCWKSDHDGPNKENFEDKDCGGFPALSIRFNVPVVEHTYPHPQRARGLVCLALLPLRGIPLYPHLITSFRIHQVNGSKVAK